jgi:hypothetical protein
MNLPTNIKVEENVVILTFHDDDDATRWADEYAYEIELDKELEDYEEEPDAGLKRTLRVEE